MQYETAGYSSAASSLAQPPQGLRNLLDRAQSNIYSAHELVSQIEDRLLGPTPRGVSASNEAMPGHPGVRVVADLSANSSDELVKRLGALLEAI